MLKEKAGLGKEEEEELGLWSNVQLITGGQSPSASRQLSRSVLSAENTTNSHIEEIIQN